jgi:hemolysin activation/secretion protein
LGWTAVPESWGSSTGYSITEGFINQYISFVKKQVLALRAYGRFTPSGTPYSGLSTLGRTGDLRGYTAGEYVAENLIALQAEYRVRFTDKVGGAAFGGVSQLYNGSFKNTTSETFYPSGGIGVRYMMNTENKMNFRLDYAWGTGNESGFYMSVGEAF